MVGASARERAALVRLLVLDVDGVLTDGGLYYDAEGNVSKRFNVQDGLGIKVAQAAGLEIAVITGLESKAVEKRVRELGVEEYHAGHLAKAPLLEGMRRARGLEWSQLAYLGDDWVDAGPLGLVG
ncbi:phenylphosphate carboxylase subunit delta, partial [Desulfocurvus sp.]|uniref:KdsC family phosphatase n=1 Tax=Desulfocurvus sp. TaxID=2871698 RepID=UPI0025C260DC